MSTEGWPGPMAPHPHPHLAALLGVLMGLGGGKHGKPKPSLKGGAIPPRKSSTPKTPRPSKAPKKPWWKKGS